MADEITRFEQLISEALQQAFSGSDFAFISERFRMDPLPWNYREQVLEKVRLVHALLDMDTGGGEILASLSPLPELTYATEGYLPNIPIARSRLEPLGVQVSPLQAEDILPFEEKTFELVINRHGSLPADEIYRVLAKGGIFFTQQVGGQNNIRLNHLLNAPAPSEDPNWNAARAIEELEKQGFLIIDWQEDFPATVITDIGAVVYYLQAIPWQIPDFSVEKYHKQLFALHKRIESKGSLVIRSHRFYIEALK
ncbi:MAG: SAM-dependent methyltransferase [Chloroflexi bacterium]|nr:SAM-dependent methyltransferase [Chloroflexota bacterium]